MNKKNGKKPNKFNRRTDRMNQGTGTGLGNEAVQDQAQNPEQGSDGTAMVSNEVVRLGSFTSTMRPGLNNGFENNTATFYRTTQGVEPSTIDIKVAVDSKVLTTPSICSIDLAHTFGSLNYPGGVSSVVFQSAQNLRQYVATALGTDFKWDAGDLAVYIMAWADVLEKVVEIKRVFGILNMYDKYPSLYPLGALKAMGIGKKSGASYKDLTSDDLMELAAGVPAHAARLNAIIHRIRTAPVPAEFGLLTANHDLYSKLYADHEDISTAQIYCFKSSGYWKYEEDKWASSMTVSSAISYHTWGDVKTLGDMLVALDSMVRAIIDNSSSFQMMQAINNAYGNQSDRFLYVSDLDATAIVDVVYDDKIMISIENANLISDLALPLIYAGPNPIYLGGAPYVPCGDPGATGAAVNLPLQFHCSPEDVTDEMIAAALRLHPYFNTIQRMYVYTSGGQSSEVDALSCVQTCGFAVPQGIKIYTWAKTDSGYDFVLTSTAAGKTDIGTPIIMDLASFKHAPALVAVAINESTTDTLTTKTVTVQGSTLQRDLEVTIELSRISWWFTATTEAAWAANIVRRTKGQREMLG